MPALWPVSVECGFTRRAEVQVLDCHDDPGPGRRGTVPVVIGRVAAFGFRSVRRRQSLCCKSEHDQGQTVEHHIDADE